jgi:hypothetical protein
MYALWVSIRRRFGYNDGAKGCFRRRRTLADTIGTQSPPSYLNEARRQLQQAHRERPDQHVPHGDGTKKKTLASDLPASQAIRKAEEGQGREPYNPANRQAQVMVQELAAQLAVRGKKAAEWRRHLSRRSGPYKSRREPDQPSSPPNGAVKLTV